MRPACIRYGAIRAKFGPFHSRDARTSAHTTRTHAGGLEASAAARSVLVRLVVSFSAPPLAVEFDNVLVIAGRTGQSRLLRGLAPSNANIALGPATGDPLTRHLYVNAINGFENITVDASLLVTHCSTARTTVETRHRGAVPRNQRHAGGLRRQRRLHWRAAELCAMGGDEHVHRRAGLAGGQSACEGGALPRIGIRQLVAGKSMSALRPFPSSRKIERDQVKLGTINRWARVSGEHSPAAVRPEVLVFLPFFPRAQRFTRAARLTWPAARHNTMRPRVYFLTPKLHGPDIRSGAQISGVLHAADSMLSVRSPHERSRQPAWVSKPSFIGESSP